MGGFEVNCGLQACRFRENPKVICTDVGDRLIMRTSSKSSLFKNPVLAMDT